MKENDDDRWDESANDDDEGLLGGGLKGSNWRKNLLRRLSLALAIYGFVVMVTCLTTNILFLTAH